MTTATTDNPLLSLLEQAQQTLQREQREKAARFEAGKRAIQEYLETSLPDLWPTLGPHAEVSYKETRGNAIEAIWAFRLPDEMRLAVMRLFIRAIPQQEQDGMTWRADGYWSYKNGSRRFPLSATDKAVLDARIRWERADLDRRLNEARSIIEPLRYYHQAPDDEAKALALVEQAETLCPENADEWQNAIARWREIQTDRQKQARQERKRALTRTLADVAAAEDEGWLESHIALCIREFPDDREQWEAYLRQGREVIAARRIYRQALQTCARQRLDVLAANRAKAADLLAKLAVPVEAYELTYGICAEDEEGERYVETRSVIVLDADPDEAGYWQVARRYGSGSAEPVRYLHPVSVAPVSAPVREMEVSELGKSIEYPATRSSEEIRQALDALELTPLPPLPKAPDVLDTSTREAFLQNIREVYPDAFPEVAPADEALSW